MKHLIVTECFKSIRISAGGDSALTPFEADELSRYVRLNRLKEDLVRITRTEVTFINYVGFIQLGTCSIEILPKVSGDDPAQSRRVLLRMLQRTGYLDIHESQIGQLTIEKMNLFEIIAYLYSGKLLKELNRGVYHNYRTEQDALPSVRGRIDVAAQIRRSHTMSTSVSCIYDEFHRDNALNRLLKAALRRIMVLSKHYETRKNASHALLYLDEAEDVAGQHLWKETIIFDRRNLRYEESGRLASLLLSQSSPSSSAGKVSSSSILFEMNDLFEKYVAYLARRVTARVKEQDKSRKLLIKESTEGKVFQLKPDLLITTNGTPMIIDTKWKRIGSTYARHGVQRDDFYQMYAYLTRYEKVKNVILLYPHNREIAKASGTCLESWHLEQNPDKKLRVYTINYEDEKKAIEDLRRIIG